MKAKINEGCIGCAMCSIICPNNFRMNQDNLAEVFDDIEPFNELSAQEACANCPVGVIVIEEE